MVKNVKVLREDDEDVDLKTILNESFKEAAELLQIQTEAVTGQAEREADLILKKTIEAIRSTLEAKEEARKIIAKGVDARV